MLLIKNCKVLENGKAVERNIIAEGGWIQKITAPSAAKSADETINAKGMLAIPGLIDAHVHCREPGMTQKEDFRTAGYAAAAGGVTTILDMPNNRPATTTTGLLEEKRKLAAEKCIANYGFHFGATEGNLAEIRKATNIASVKVFMGSSTGDLLISDEGALDSIMGSGRRISVHAEDEAMLKANEKSQGAGTWTAERHLEARNKMVAASAASLAITAAKRKNARMHLCHISTTEETELMAKFRRNMNLSCEVTPHHLFLPVEDAAKLGTMAKVNPPLRRKEDVAALWNALNSGTIDMVATDHAPHLLEEKSSDEPPSGMPGLETMLPLLLDAANKGRLSMQQVISLTSANPARIFGIQSRGHIAEGYFADITLIDLKKEKTVKNDELQTKSKWSAFEGWKLKGAVTSTIINGRLAYDGNQVIDEHKGNEAMFG